MATNFKGKVIGLSIKDRGAILPAADILLIGHFGTAQQVHLFLVLLWFKFANWVEFNQERYMNYINKVGIY
jgi:hypothetical protein